MASSGKYTSVNVNRSHGNHRPSSAGAAAGGGTGHGRGGGGNSSYGGGGMVVLSRARGGGGLVGQKVVPPKLSVPPPLNLPSLRKEHERFDLSTAGTGAGHRGSGPGHGAGSSVMGWTKPAALAGQLGAKEKDSGIGDVGGQAQRGPGHHPGGMGLGGGSTQGFVEKAVILRGEDFPSLRASVTSQAPKQKETSGHFQRPRQGVGEDAGLEHAMMSMSQPLVGMRPQLKPSQADTDLGRGGGSDRMTSSSEQLKKHDDGFPAPLPQVRYHSDWADDERDTGLSFLERDRERITGYSRGDPLSASHDLYIGRGRESHDSSWRAPTLGSRGQPATQEHGVERDRVDGRHYHEGPQMGRDSLSRESSRHSNSSNGWNRASLLQNNIVDSKMQPSSGIKSHLLSVAVAKFTNPEPYIEDSGFDGVTSLNLKVLKKKKEVQKVTDFHDPIRESFEAELDQILRMQEQDRKRVMEEQARAQEQARKEGEEKERMIREEEARRQALEEEARRTAWLAEQERLEAARRAEEQRLAREEEKRRIQIEEERRKEAAKQKLLELEARIAKRQSEANPRDERPLTDVEDRFLPRSVDDATNVNDHANHSLLENSRFIRPFDPMRRMYDSRVEQSSILGRGDMVYYGGRPSLQDQESILPTPHRDALGSRRNSFKKEPLGATVVSAQLSSKVGAAKTPWLPNDYNDGAGSVPRLDISGDNELSNQQQDYVADVGGGDRFGRAGWMPGKSYGSPHVEHGDRMFQTPEANGFQSPAKSRYSVRQPRVPPPPLPPLAQRKNFDGLAPHAGSSSSFVSVDTQNHGSRNTQHHDTFYNARQDNREHPTVPLVDDNVTHWDQNAVDGAPCGSQSSHSISSPPRSPMHMLHDEMDVSGDLPALPNSADGERSLFSDNDHLPLATGAIGVSRLATASSVSQVEDDDWPSMNNEDVQQQDEFDDGDDYRSGANIEGDSENLEIAEDFAELRLEEHDAYGVVEQIILGFDNGVEVEIPPAKEFDQTLLGHEERTEVQGTSATLQKNATTVMSEGNLFSGSVTSNDVNGSSDSTNKTITSHDSGVGQMRCNFSPGVVDQVGICDSPPLQPAASACSQLMTPSLAAPAVVSTPAIAAQSELPFNIRFGLFPSPPIPAIQIGSIQMPIHLHDHLGISMRPSTAPLFQFGHLPRRIPMPQHAGRFTSQVLPQLSKPAPNSLAQSSLSSKMVSKSYTNGHGKSLLKTSASIMSTSRSQGDQIGQEVNQITSDQNNDVPLLDSHRGTQPELLHPHVFVSEYPENQMLNVFENSHLALKGEVSSAPRSSATGSNSRIRRHGARGFSSGLGTPNAEASHRDSRGYHRRSRRNIRRMEFRARESAHSSHMQVSEGLPNVNQDSMPNANIRTPRISMRDRGFGKLPSATNATSIMSSGNSTSLPSIIDRNGSIGKLNAKETTRKGSSNPYSLGANENSVTSTLLEEGLNPLMQNGNVVAEQQGFELPIDADGFIEVRSKKHIMNVRREQREREYKSKLRAAKVPRRQHTVNPPSGHDMKSATSELHGYVSHSPSDFIHKEGKSPGCSEVTFVSRSCTITHSLPPIGPPSSNVDIHVNSKLIKSAYNQQVPDPDACVATKLSNNRVASVVTSSPLDSWDCSVGSQQVMPLTQTQLEEAMNPTHFEPQASSNFSLEAVTGSSVSVEETSFGSSSPVGTHAGEKIQFGEEALSMVQPLANRADNAIPTVNKDSIMFFDKAKPTHESSAVLEDSEAEAEAEAAASAVAVAAITSDEVVGSMESNVHSVLDKQDRLSGKITGSTARGSSSGQDVTGQTSAEETLTVALPVDLSVDTTAVALWPLQSPQASGAMLSQCSTSQSLQPSCSQMNPVLGGQLFPYGHDESAGSQGHSQRRTTLSSGTLAPWSQYQTGLDPFYRPPSGFATPFIGNGGIPGMQGPPMFVYNHFTPVGQFGQVGLGFMGPAYIHTDKQPDWKHNQMQAVGGVNQIDPGNKMAGSVQLTSQALPAQIQHVCPTSPLIPMPPQPMFDVTSYQPADMPMQSCWSRLHAQQIHGLPLSMPLPPHLQEGGINPQFRHGVAQLDNSASNNRFHEVVFPTPSDSKGFQPTTMTPFPDELGLIEPSGQPSFVHVGNSGTVAIHGKSTADRSNPTAADGSGGGSSILGNSNVAAIQDPGRASSKPRHHGSSGSQFYHPAGNLERRGRGSQKAGPAVAWHHRRQGSSGRNSQSLPTDKGGFVSGRVKQIYVAKPSAGGGGGVPETSSQGL